MRFYYIKDSYIDFLRKYDLKVSINKQESRPYVGVVLEVDGIKYYAPFTSPKAKHLNMKNRIDFRKIEGGNYGAINFNNMIPVVETALIYIDIASITDTKYRRLLQNQFNSIQSDSLAILSAAYKLRKLVLEDDDKLSKFELQIKKRCCDLKVLEKVYSQYHE